MQQKKSKNNGRPTNSKKNTFSKSSGVNNRSSKPTTNTTPKETSSKPATIQPKKADEIRLNKYLSNAGVCARREADIYIQSGNVKVNGKVVTEMGSLIKLTDEVHFDGVLITPGKKEYILLNKPKNFATSSEDTLTNRNVLELIRGASKSQLLPVGRMDKNTTGLLLFTNDTALLTKFSGANQRTSKIYHLSLSKNLKYEDLEKIKTGITIDDHRIYVEDVSYIENEPKTEIGIKLKTANIKVVRNIFEHLKYDVLRVDRVYFAGLTKKNLPRGNWRPLTEQEIINLKNG